MTRPRQLPFGWTLAAILAAALILRLAAGWWWQQRLPPGTQFGFGDSASYWELAGKIARGQPYEYGPDRLQIFRTPGYPLALAPLFLIRDDPPVMWARAQAALFTTIAVGAVALLGRLLFDRPTALLAAAIAAIYPEAIAAGAFVLSEAAFTPLMLGHLICWVLAWKAPAAGQATGWSAAAGFAGGMATLVRPSWLLFAPFALVMGLALVRWQHSVTEGVPYRRHLLICGVMLAALCLTMLPWWARNYRVADRFVPTSLQIGASLYDGISPTATGASDMDFVGGFVAAQRAADLELGADRRGLFEDRLDRRMRAAAIDFARRNPERVLELAAAKLLRMWSPLPNAAEFQSTALRIILAATYTPVIMLALLGAWRFAGRDWSLQLCLLPALYFTLLHVVFVSSIRYRQPAMLPLIVLAAAAALAEFKVQGSRFRRPRCDITSPSSFNFEL
jgi:4-amino-4-deoxy-L-arabinose transferase-like glycosyltransferase